MADLLNHEFWTPLKPGANVSRAKREPTQRPMSRSPCGQSTWRRVKVNVIWYGWCWCRHQGHETRWWQLKCFWNFHPETWGRFPIWRAYFSKGLVQPPTRWNQGMIIPVFVVRKETKSWNLPLKKHDFRTWFCYRFGLTQISMDDLNASSLNGEQFLHPTFWFGEESVVGQPTCGRFDSPRGL